MDQQPPPQQVTPKAMTPCTSAAGTTLGRAVQPGSERTPQGALTVPVDEDETQDPSAGMEGKVVV